MLDLPGGDISKEMIVHFPRRRKYFFYPTAVPGIERVDKMIILGITVSSTLTFQLLLPKALVHCMLLRPFVHMGSAETRCGTLHVLHWSHNSCMLALPGGDTLKLTKKTGFSPS